MPALPQELSRWRTFEQQLSPQCDHGVQEDPVCGSFGRRGTLFEPNQHRLNLTSIIVSLSSSELGPQGNFILDSYQYIGSPGRCIIEYGA